MGKLDFDKIEKQEIPIYIDLRLLRNAYKELNEDGLDITINELLDLAFKKRIVITSSEEPKNDPS